MYYTPLPFTLPSTTLLLPDANGNHLYHFVSFNITRALLSAIPSSQHNKCTLSSVEALACTDARKDHAVLELFCFFFLSREKS